jgi:uncharacterized protein YjbJ (UPF0337 family)
MILFNNHQTKGEPDMNEDILKGKWKELKGEIKEKWGSLNDDDLAQVEGKEEQLLGLLQQRYGYARETAEEEYKGFMDTIGSPHQASKLNDAGKK